MKYHRSGNPRRTNMHRLKRVQQLALCVLVGVLASGLFHLFLRVPYFFVTDVRVSGNRLIPDAVLLEKALPYMGAHLLRVDTRALESHIKGFYQVQSVRVRRHWPGRIDIEVGEEPALVGMVLEGDVKWIDHKGRVLNTFGDVGRVDFSEVPVVQGVPRSAFLEQGLRLQAAWLAVITQVVGVLPQKQMTLAFRSPDDVVLYYEGSLAVFLGSPTDLEVKLTRLRGLLHYVDHTMLEYVDIRFPERTVIKPMQKEPWGHDA